jgi:betaine-aldehyde dehydrogenase
VIAKEEIFGPVLCVIPAYGVSRRLRSGTVGHNGVRTDGSIAFGGVKRSGIGRKGGAEGLREYLESMTVLLDEEPQWTSA